MKNIRYILILVLVAGIASSCKEKLDPQSIFPEVSESLDPASYSFQLDSFCKKNFQEIYNVEFRYQMQDISSNMNFNLVPCTYDDAITMAVMAKYLWWDVYTKVTGSHEFLQKYGPRIICLIGSAGHNATGSVTLGVAQGGLKVTLHALNYIDPSNVATLNEYYFKTMHHEFSHILHQTKTYPAEFRTISAGWYKPNGWEERSEQEARSLGFTGNYGSSQEREDFVEIIANYIVKTDDEWASMMSDAAKGWKQDDNGTLHQLEDDPDGVDGPAVIEQKLTIARTWLHDEWNIELDSLRKEVQTRQANMNIDSLRNQVLTIGTGE
ncbi:MAG: hypothetical protein IJ650_06435 [Paludibacteraceae bacterium]|nr:hypothetical protein [Paludibacteraceae bacterium]